MVNNMISIVILNSGQMFIGELALVDTLKNPVLLGLNSDGSCSLSTLPSSPTEIILKSNTIAISYECTDQSLITTYKGLLDPETLMSINESE